MLTVITDGVKIELTAEPHPNQRLTFIIISAIFFTAIGLGLSLGWLSARLSIIAIAIIALLSWGWQYYQQKFNKPIITGGHIIVQNKQITHLSATGTQQRLFIETTDTIQQNDTMLSIFDQQGNVRYQILGFQQPQHATIAQNVLQGKTIKTQGKAIKMQSN